jgi:YHS domain-containing protein
MDEIRTIDANEDPVCGMTVDVDQARAKRLIAQHDGREYVFCGKGCMLDFSEEPERYLSRDYRPSM